MDALEPLDLEDDISGTYDDGATTVDVRLRRVKADDSSRWWVLSALSSSDELSVGELLDVGVIHFDDGWFAHVQLSPPVNGSSFRLAVSADAFP